MTPTLFKTSPALLSSLKARYAEPHRKYHTWSHIEQLLQTYAETASLICKKDEVQYAIYYHDAIYAVPSATNEDESAALFEQDAQSALARDTIDLVKKFILATKNHTIGPDFSDDEKSDCELFLDMDMSILGAAQEDYRAYSRAIREEYSIIPDEIYRAGRAKVLSHFISRERLFLSPPFHDNLDSQARDNIRNELRELQA